MTSAPSIGVGIVGLSARGGWAGRSHVPALTRVLGLDVVACSASSPETARAAAQRYGVPRAYGNAASLVADPNLDVVLVCVKTPDHRDVVLAALEAGKGVYCEWPLGVDRAETEELASVARETGRLAVVGLQSRMSPPLTRIRQLLAQGVIGSVESSGLTGYGLMGGPSQSTRNAYQLDSRNGASVRTIPVAHCLDAMAHVLGPWKQLSGVGVVAHPKVRIVETGDELVSDSVDHVAVAGTLGDGVGASLLVRPGLPKWGGPGLRWELTGSDGVMEIIGSHALPQMTELSVRIRNGAGDRLLPWVELCEGVGILDPLQLPLVKTWEAIGGLLAGEHWASEDETPRPATFEDALGLHQLLGRVDDARGRLD